MFSFHNYYLMIFTLPDFVKLKIRLFLAIKIYIVIYKSKTPNEAFSNTNWHFLQILVNLITKKLRLFNI